MKKLISFKKNLNRKFHFIRLYIIDCSFACFFFRKLIDFLCNEMSSHLKLSNSHVGHPVILFTNSITFLRRKICTSKLKPKPVRPTKIPYLTSRRYVSISFS